MKTEKCFFVVHTDGRFYQYKAKTDNWWLELNLLDCETYEDWKMKSNEEIAKEEQEHEEGTKVLGMVQIEKEDIPLLANKDQVIFDEDSFNDAVVASKKFWDAYQAPHAFYSVVKFFDDHKEGTVKRNLKKKEAIDLASQLKSENKEPSVSYGIMRQESLEVEAIFSPGQKKSEN